MLIDDFPIVSIEAYSWIINVCVVQHYIVVAEECISKQVSLLTLIILAIDEELAGIFSLNLVFWAKVLNLLVNRVVLLTHSQNILCIAGLIILFG